MDRLSPPQIANKLPAFNTEEIDIAFNITRAVGPTDFSAVRVVIRTVQNSQTKLEETFNTIYKDVNTNEFHVRISLKDTGFTPLIGQYYKVQLALVRSGENPVIGYYSNVGIIKFTGPTRAIIKELEESNQRHLYTYTGVYTHVEDITEKAYSYRFNLYNSHNELIATSGELIHDNSKDKEIDQSTDEWSVRQNLEANIQYQIEYIVTTINGLKVVSNRYIIIEAATQKPNIHAVLSSQNYFDDGYIVSTLIGDRSGKKVNGKFILMRSSSEDNFNTWYELTKFDLTNWNSNSDLIICKDYSVQQGIKYIYAIRAFNSVGLVSDRLINIEGEILADFEDAFLYDGERQLKIRFNPKVSSFKSTILESKTDTLGGQYPFIFRNGNVAYKEFSISGLISLLSDENNEFLSNLSPAANEIREESGHCLTADNFRKEREFKMLVLSWLTNGKPKLFRSPAEGNFIVYLMNTSLSPNDTLSRMLHTFSSTAYEIAEFNFDNLKKFGFTVDDYIETRNLRIDVYNSDYLKYVDSILFSKPASYVSIIAAPGTIVSYILADGTGQMHTLEIGNTGTYIFSHSVLIETPMLQINLIEGDWGDNGSITYGWYDTSADDFSIIRNIVTNDEIIQLNGKGTNYNLLIDLEDIRRKTGAIHWLKVQPRQISTIYKLDDSGTYYWNNGLTVVNLATLDPHRLYFIAEGFADDAPVRKYLDGAEQGSTERNISHLSYNFYITGVREGTTIDFNGHFNTDAGTTGRYEALTNLNNINAMYVGNGIEVNMVYQNRTLLYVVEDPSDFYADENVIRAKSDWQNALIEYETNTGDKSMVDYYYGIYIHTLETSLEKLAKNWEDVEYAL